MANVVRIDFKQHDQQWLVTLTDADGKSQSGEPFPASDSQGPSKLAEVLDRIHELGYSPTRTPYNRVSGSHYVFEVRPRQLAEGV